MFAGEALDNGMDFEPEDGKVDNEDDANKGGYNKGGGDTGSPFPASVKTTGE